MSPRRRAARFALTVLLLAAPAAAGTNRWTPFGPGAGSFFSVAVAPTSPPVLWAAMGYGGLYRSADGGESWTWAGLGFGHDFLRQVAVDPRDPAVLYVATDTAFQEFDAKRVLGSTDGGHSWAEMFRSEGPTDLPLRVATAPGVVYVVTPRTLLRSRDRGATWAALFGGAGRLRDLALDPVHPRLLYLIASPSDPDLVYALPYEAGIFAARFEPQRKAPSEGEEGCYSLLTTGNAHL
jgi:hypothetical protein